MNDPQTQRFQALLEGRYAIERELGRGGMATVYLARDLRHGRTVAINRPVSICGVSVSPVELVIAVEVGVCFVTYDRDA